MPPPPAPPPSIPVVARNQQTGESVRLDVGAEIQRAVREAIAGAIQQNGGNLHANAQRALVKTVQGQKPTVTHSAKDDDGENIVAAAGDALEEAWTGGPVTTRTFVQGMAIDVGFALMATLATVTSSSFDVYDKEAWTLVGALMLKTVIQTGISFAMRLKVQ